MEYLGINPYVLYSKGEEKTEETKEISGIFYVTCNDVSGAWHRKLIGGKNYQVTFTLDSYWESVTFGFLVEPGTSDAEVRDNEDNCPGEKGILSDNGEVVIGELSIVSTDRGAF